MAMALTGSVSLLCSAGDEGPVALAIVQVSPVDCGVYHHLSPYLFNVYIPSQTVNLFEDSRICLIHHRLPTARFTEVLNKY